MNRALTATLLVFSLGFLEGCRANGEYMPYPKDRDYQVMANAGRPFLVHLAGQVEPCRAIRVVGTLQRSTVDTLDLSVIKEIDAATPRDPLCPEQGAGVVVLTESTRRPSVATVGRTGQRFALLAIAVSLVFVLTFSGLLDDGR